MMKTCKRRTRLLVTTALASAALAVAATTLSATLTSGARAANDPAHEIAPGGSGAIAARSASATAGAASTPFDPAFLARSICGMAVGTGVAPPYVVVAEAVAARAVAEDETVPPLWDNLGTISFPVTTSNVLAQRYFDQGLRLAYGFNHEEARRAFRMAQRLDPSCAMCFWGEALVLGPNINLPMPSEAAVPALAAVRKAEALRSGATGKEQALIWALAKRYSADPEMDRNVLDATYADAMAEVAAQYPKDHDIAVLAAEAMMDTQPWDYWEADGETPKGRTAGIIKILESVLDDADHPAAIHLYIHMTEASTTPERAEPYADRLASLMPGAGHLVHMPSHTYFRIGRYRDSLAVNVAAVKADEAYLSGVEGEGLFYANAYYPHNIHFVVESARMAGVADTALAYAQKLDSVLSDDVVREVAWVQAIKVAPSFAHAQFSDPQTILAIAKPADDLPYVKSMWHYMRAIAYASAGDAERAAAEAEAMAEIAATADFQAMIEGGVPAPDLIALAGHVVAARIAQAKADLPQAAEAFRRAVEIQDGLPYMEPPYWYYPVRQSLGAVLLEQGKAAEAEMVFRRTLMEAPNNGWALYGLLEAQKAQGDMAGAAQTADLLNNAWLGERATLSLARL
jgi:tetratricopeptide (TPR) repeat protein